MTPNEILMNLSSIWITCVIDYPEANHMEILKHIEALQMLVIQLFFIRQENENIGTTEEAE
jgi:hypothetical protein